MDSITTRDIAIFLLTVTSGAIGLAVKIYVRHAQERLDLATSELHATLKSLDSRFDALAAKIEALKDRTTELDITMRSSYVTQTRLKSDVQELKLEIRSKIDDLRDEIRR